MSVPTSKFHLNLLAVAIISLFLTACGLPGPGGGSNSSPKPDAQFVPVTEIPVRVEANEEMVASWQRSLFKLITPEQSYALNGLQEINDLNPLRISLVTLNEDFEERGYSSLPDYRVEEGETGGYVIQLDQNYYGQLDIVAKVRFSNGNVLYAPLNNLSNSNINSVVINIGSHYILKKLFDQVSSKAELDALRPCDSASCSDQWRLKADLLKNLNASIQDYDLTIPNNMLLEDALALLDDNVDFRNQVERTIREIIREKEPIHQGTNRAFNITDPDVQECLIKSRDYNSTWFGLMLNNVKPQNAQNEVMLSTATSTLSAPGQTGQIVPILQQSTDIREIRREALTVKNYMSRDTLTIDDLDNFIFDGSGALKKMFSSTSSTYISTEGFMLYDRTFPPNIPTATDNIGQQFNPIFSKLYKANKHACATDPVDYSPAPAWLVGSSSGTGSRYSLQMEGAELATDNDNKFIRDEFLEQQNIFSWEIFSEETETSFSEDAIDNKRFGAITFSVELSEVGETIGVNAHAHLWQENLGSIDQNQPQEHYSSFRIARMDNQSAVSLSEQSNINIESRAISDVKTKHVSDTIPQSYGAMLLDGGSQPSYGHSTQDGRYLAFTLDNGIDGRGLLIAQELRALGDRPIFSDTGDEYALLGNMISLNASNNALTHLNNSTLTIGGNFDACNAVLTLDTLSVAHDVNSNTLGDLTSSTSTVLSSNCRLGSAALTDQSGSEIELSFDNVNGQALTLKGFVSQNDEGDNHPPLMTLLWIQDDTLGLVFATYKQNLSEGFE